MARAVARIDLGAVGRNCAQLDATVGDGAELCAVVKADGYGHGADCLRLGRASPAARPGSRSPPGARRPKSAAAFRTCRC